MHQPNLLQLFGNGMIYLAVVYALAAIASIVAPTNKRYMIIVGFATMVISFGVVLVNLGVFMMMCLAYTAIIGIALVVIWHRLELQNKIRLAALASLNFVFVLGSIAFMAISIP